MHKISLLFMLCATVAFSSCNNDVDGLLRVESPLTLKDQKGRTFTISSSREMNVNPENVGDIGDEEVKLKLEDDSGKERKMKLEVPSYKQIPENGSLMLEAAETGQAFDLYTEVETVRDRGPQQNDYESCTYTRTEWRCWHTPRGRQCGYLNVQYQGRRQIVGHTETINVRAHSRFLAPGTSRTLASFAGARRDQYWVTEYSGSCGW